MYVLNLFLIYLKSNNCYFKQKFHISFTKKDYLMKNIDTLVT